MSRRRRAGLLAGYALTSFLAFPQPLGSAVLDLGWALAWIAPALLLAGLRGLAPASAARHGFLAGLAAHALVLHWIYVVTVQYGHAPKPVGMAAPLALAAYVALFTAVFAALTAWLARAALAWPAALACAWTALEHLRSFALSGFPWATLGYAQHQNAALRPLAAWTGVYGLSFVTVLGAAALTQAAGSLMARRRPTRGVWAALALVALAHAAGLALRPAEPDAPRVLRVGVLQGNVEQGVKWSPDWAERTLGIYAELSREAARRGAQVVVWPETAVPGAVETSDALRERLAALARETGASFVVGAVGIDADPEQPGGLRFYDSAHLIDSDGSFEDRYDKAHLVPFGEYVPLQQLLGRLVVAVARGAAITGVTAGPGPRGLDLSLPGGPPVRVGVPICYELVFPDLVRRFVDDGAEVLFAITNDAWYGRTGAPYQFLAITALRSAESRVWTARAANTGVSAIIDAQGRVRSRTPIFERGLLVEDVPLHPAPIGGSFYARHGDVFALACWIGTILTLAASRVRRTRLG